MTIFSDRQIGRLGYRAILFDFDGVLGDTMEDNYAAWYDAFAAHGISLQREEYFPLEGMNVITVAQTILHRRHADPDLAPVISDLKEIYYRQHNRFRLYPGVAAAIDRLRQRYTLGLVSGAGRTRLQATVPAKFLTAFGVVITGDDVRFSKPHPEPYRMAAERLDIEPHHCLVVENAPLGITAAKRAGMECVALCTTLASQFLQDADMIIDTIHQLGSVLGEGA